MNVGWKDQMIMRLKEFFRRLTGVSTLWGGVSWALPEPDPVERMAEQYLEKSDIPNVALKMPLIIQVGGATLPTNEKVLSLCKRIEMHGKPHPFSSWFRQGLHEHECLAFIMWQIKTKQGVSAVPTDEERKRTISSFRGSSINA
jgi:hypothetical protein